MYIVVLLSIPLLTIQTSNITLHAERINPTVLVNINDQAMFSVLCTSPPGKLLIQALGTNPERNYMSRARIKLKVTCNKSSFVGY